MPNLYSQFSVSLLFVTLLTLSAAAQEPLSPEALVREALARNPELNYYRAEIAAAKGERSTAGKIANPEFSSQLGAKHAEDPKSGATRTGLAASISISQTVEYPGRLALRKAIANRQIDLAGLGYAQFRATLAAQTRAVAFTIFLAGEKAAAAKEVADRFEALSGMLRQRESAGVAPALELQIIEAQASNARRRANEAKLAVRTARFKLNQFRDRPFDQEQKVAATELFFRSPEPRARLFALAMANSFELRIRQLELAQQGLRVSLARNERYPPVAIGPFYSHEQSGSVGEKQDMAGLSVSVPLPIWNRNAGSIATAQARQQQAESSFAMTQREVERKVAENAAIYEAKVTELSQRESEGIEKLRESTNLADRHYRSGALPLTTYVEIQKQYLETVEAVLQAKTNALQAAQELEILTGLTLHKSGSPKERERKTR
jgi:outer membrane protein, heavy metal efflux system